MGWASSRCRYPWKLHFIMVEINHIDICTIKMELHDVSGEANKLANLLAK